MGSTAYKHFDYLVLWYASDYVSLNKEQKTQLSDASKSFISWHRSNEIEKYKQTLAQFKSDIQNQTMTKQRADYYRQEVRLYLSKVRFYLSPQLTLLLKSLSDQQYLEIADALEEELNKNDKTLSSKERFKQMKKETEEWYGPLAPTQLNILKDINTKREKQAPNWKTENQKWVTSFQTASKLPAEIRTNQIKALLLMILTPSNTHDYSEKSEWMAIWELADDKQRKAILAKLAEYQELLDDISP